MQNKMTSMKRDNAILSNVTTGMDVYDSQNNKVGTADVVHFGEGHEAAGTGEQGRQGQRPIVDAVARLFASNDSLPDDLRGRLLRHGYVTVDTDPLKTTAFFIPENIHRVEDDSVYLNQPQDDVLYR